MQFEIKRDQLLKSLNFVQGVVEKKNTLPILSNVLLNIKNNKLNKFIYLSQFNYIPNCPLIEYIANSNDSKLLKKSKSYIFYLLIESGLSEELRIIKNKDLFNFIYGYSQRLY